jgi:hypothetical protein
MTSVNPSCKVVNNSSKAVVVLDAYQSATTVAAYSTATGYQQALKALPLSTGGTVLAAGATATVTLNDTYVSNGQTKPSYIYQLLISEPAGLFPVANVGEVINFTTEAYPDVVVTDAEAANMALGFAFVQNIMAYPGSQLATGFVSAMNSAQGQSSSTSMVQTVDAYFNSTKSYQGLDFASYLAISTHMKQFAWTWGLSASGSPGRTYYLYAQSDANGGSTGSSSSSGQGSVTITLPASAPSPADPTDSNSGYVTTLSTGNTPLYFANGQFVDNPNVDIPGICLQGTYALKSTFTQKSTDNVLWPVLIGTVNGVKVIGVSQEPADATTTWLKSLLPKSFDDLFNDFMKIMGLAMAIDFLKNKLSGKKEALDNDEANENDGEPPNPEQEAAADAGAEQIGNEAQQQAQDVADHMGVDDSGQSLIEVPQEAAIPQAQIDANVDQVQALDQVQGDAYQGAIDEYRGQLEELAEIGTPPALEDAAGQLMEANEQLSEARVNSDFSDVSQSLSEVSSNINLSVEQLGSEVSEQVQDNIKESQVVADEYEESAESIEDQSSQVEEGTEDFEPEFAE